MPRVIAPVFVFALSCFAQSTGSIEGEAGNPKPNVAIQLLSRLREIRRGSPQ